MQEVDHIGNQHRKRRGDPVIEQQWYSERRNVDDVSNSISRTDALPMSDTEDLDSSTAFVGGSEEWDDLLQYVENMTPGDNLTTSQFQHHTPSVFQPVQAPGNQSLASGATKETQLMPMPVLPPIVFNAAPQTRFHQPSATAEEPRSNYTTNGKPRVKARRNEKPFVSEGQKHPAIVRAFGKQHIMINHQSPKWCANCADQRKNIGRCQRKCIACDTYLHERCEFKFHRDQRIWETNDTIETWRAFVGDDEHKCRALGRKTNDDQKCFYKYCQITEIPRACCDKCDAVLHPICIFPHHVLLDPQYANVVMPRTHGHSELVRPPRQPPGGRQKRSGGASNFMNDRTLAIQKTPDHDTMVVEEKGTENQHQVDLDALPMSGSGAAGSTAAFVERFGQWDNLAVDADDAKRVVNCTTEADIPENATVEDLQQLLTFYSSQVEPGPSAAETPVNKLPFVDIVSDTQIMQLPDIPETSHDAKRPLKEHPIGIIVHRLEATRDRACLECKKDTRLHCAACRTSRWKPLHQECTFNYHFQKKIFGDNHIIECYIAFIGDKKHECKSTQEIAEVIWEKGQHICGECRKAVSRSVDCFYCKECKMELLHLRCVYPFHAKLRQMKMDDAVQTILQKVGGNDGSAVNQGSTGGGAFSENSKVRDFRNDGIIIKDAIPRSAADKGATSRGVSHDGATNRCTTHGAADRGFTSLVATNTGANDRGSIDRGATSRTVDNQGATNRGPTPESTKNRASNTGRITEKMAIPRNAIDRNEATTVKHTSITGTRKRVCAMLCGAEKNPSRTTKMCEACDISLHEKCSFKYHRDKKIWEHNGTLDCLTAFVGEDEHRATEENRSQPHWRCVYRRCRVPGLPHLRCTRCDVRLHRVCMFPYHLNLDPAYRNIDFRAVVVPQARSTVRPREITNNPRNPPVVHNGGLVNHVCVTVPKTIRCAYPCRPGKPSTVTAKKCETCNKHLHDKCCFRYHQEKAIWERNETLECRYAFVGMEEHYNKEEDVVNPDWRCFYGKCKIFRPPELRCVKCNARLHSKCVFPFHLLLDPAYQNVVFPESL